MSNAHLPAPAPGRQEAFRHEAFLYAGVADFLAGTVPFVRDALAADEPVLVVVDRAKIDLMRAELNGDAGGVRFADMAEVGRNPARIIPAWRQFLTEHAAGGRPVRGIGEPIWAGRSPAELVECQQHESLLNVAFAGTSAWRLLCPYDTEALGPAVIDEACRSHPFVLEGDCYRPSDSFVGHGSYHHLGDPLPEPAVPPAELRFGPGLLHAVRELVRRHAALCRLGAARTADLALAVNEIATNSLRHGGGGGVMRLWQEGSLLICEVRDRGRIDQPLVGRVRPTTERECGRGLWLANQLCDLVQIRSTSGGTVVRLHMSAG